MWHSSFWSRGLKNSYFFSTFVHCKQRAARIYKALITTAPRGPMLLPLKVPGDKIWDKIICKYLVFRPLWPKSALPKPFTKTCSFTPWNQTYPQPHAGAVDWCAGKVLEAIYTGVQSLHWWVFSNQGCANFLLMCAHIFCLHRFETLCMRIIWLSNIKYHCGFSFGVFLFFIGF